jgi:hypothetical protein
MTIEELVGRLRVVKECGDDADERAGGQLLLMEADATALPVVGEAPPRETELVAVAEAAPRAATATAVANRASPSSRAGLRAVQARMPTATSATTAASHVKGPGHVAQGLPTRQPRHRQTSSRQTWMVGRQ